MLNPTKLFKFKTKFSEFKNRHPKFIKFLQYIGGGSLKENDNIEMIVRDSDGKETKTNIRLSPEDISLFEELKAVLDSEK